LLPEEDDADEPDPVEVVGAVVGTVLLTVMLPDVPVMDTVPVSIAVIVRDPVVLSVAVKVPVPPVSVASAGRVAAGSELVKCTVPGYPATGLLEPSRALTVKVNGVPLVADTGAATEKWVVALTRMLPDVPVIDDVTLSVAVIVCVPPVIRVALNVPVPAVSTEFAGRVAAPSLPEKCTVPA
jgi:hypothetical protein